MASTIKDVARIAEVSVSTVSYALNDGPRSVPPAVKAKVIRVAKELDYRPNRIARSLITGRTFAIGVVPTDVMLDLAQVAYFSAVFNGIVNAAEGHEHDVTLLTRSKGRVDSVLDGRTDGLVFIAPLPDSPALLAARDRGIPHTVISTHVEWAPCVTGDNVSGVRLALDHLYDLGHRRIAHIVGKSGHEDAAARLAAYETFVAERGLVADVLPGDFTPSGGEAAIETISRRSRPPTALFCANDDTALGATLAARRYGIRVPDDLSIVGYDDAFFAPLLDPPLTTVRQCMGEMGAAAADALFRLLAGETPSLAPFVPRLAVRASTDRPKADTPS